MRRQLGLSNPANHMAQKVYSVGSNLPWEFPNRNLIILLQGAQNFQHNKRNHVDLFHNGWRLTYSRVIGQQDHHRVQYQHF